MDAAEVRGGYKRHQGDVRSAPLPGRAFSALELLCIMYAGFTRSEPGMDIWVELGEEWGMAERLRDDAD